MYSACTYTFLNTHQMNNFWEKLGEKDTPIIGLSPMDGVTDAPMRKLIAQTSHPDVILTEFVNVEGLARGAVKMLEDFEYDECERPVVAQIYGTERESFYKVAFITCELGFDGVDINMGCPAKKVCKTAAGSALLKDEALVAQILEAVVKAVDVPVTLKTRTGWQPQIRNGVAIAKIAEQSGIQSLAIHGRTRACQYQGQAEYETIRQIKQAVSIPVIANGDITTPEKAKYVLEHTLADGIMIGRGAQGNPWIFQQIASFLQTGHLLPKPSLDKIYKTIIEHMQWLYDFYGEIKGIKIARKHYQWYSQHFPDNTIFCQRINTAESSQAQLDALYMFFSKLTKKTFNY